MKKNTTYGSRINLSACTWFATSAALGAALVITHQPAPVIQPPKFEVIAYYNNEYQHYAIGELIKDNELEQYSCLYELWMRESRWQPNATNKLSNASGIAQLLPSTWKILKIKPTKNGFKQVNAGLKYIDRHYGKIGGICRAYAHHLAKGWY